MYSKLNVLKSIFKKQKLLTLYAYFFKAKFKSNDLIK